MDAVFPPGVQQLAPDLGGCYGVAAAGADAAHPARRLTSRPWLTSSRPWLTSSTAGTTDPQKVDMRHLLRLSSRALVLGASGMLGHKVLLQLARVPALHPALFAGGVVDALMAAVAFSTTRISANSNMSGRLSA